MRTNHLSSPFTNIIDEFVTNMQHAIHEDVRTRLNVALGVASAGKKAAKTVSAAKPRRTETKALSAARKVQGKYLGMLRTATGARRARAKYIAQEKGVKAALKHLAATAPKN